MAMCDSNVLQVFNRSTQRCVLTMSDNDVKGFMTRTRDKSTRHDILAVVSLHDNNLHNINAPAVAKHMR